LPVVVPLSVSPTGIDTASLVGLSPQSILAAMQQSTQRKQFDRAQSLREGAQPFINILRSAQTINALTPATRKTTVSPRVTINTGPDGKRTNPRDKHIWTLKPDGTLDTYIGPATTPDSSAGGNKRLKTVDLKFIEADLLPLFSDEIFAGIKSSVGGNVVEAGELMRALANPLTGYDTKTARGYLNKNPEAMRQLQTLMTKASNLANGGMDLAQAIQVVIFERMNTPIGVPGPSGLSPKGKIKSKHFGQ